MANDIRFRTKKLTRGKDRWSKRRFRQPKVGKRARDFIDANTSGGQDVRLGKSKTRDGKIDWSGAVKADTGKARTVAWLDSADGSDVLHIEVGGKTLGIMAVFVGRYVPGVDDDPNIIAFWEYCRKRSGGRAENWGIGSCRSIAGTNPPVWSAHAWKKAIDISGPRLVMALVARLGVKYHARFGLVTVIYRGKIASRSSNWKWVPYGGSCPHRRHVHVNTAYDSSKRPPCAK